MNDGDGDCDKQFVPRSITGGFPRGDGPHIAERVDPAPNRGLLNQLQPTVAPPCQVVGGHVHEALSHQLGVVSLQGVETPVLEKGTGLFCRHLFFLTL